MKVYNIILSYLTDEAKLLLDFSRDLLESSPLGLREGKHQERMNRLEKLKRMKSKSMMVVVCVMGGLWMVVGILLIMASSTTARPFRAFVITSYTIYDNSSRRFAYITEIQCFSPIHIVQKPSSEVEYRTEIERLTPRVPLGLYSVRHYSSLHPRAEDVCRVSDMGGVWMMVVILVIISGTMTAVVAWACRTLIITTYWIDDGFWITLNSVTEIQSFKLAKMNSYHLFYLRRPHSDSDGIVGVTPFYSKI
ncbi:hypothetical protein Fmac_014349 [Flemingia macrophylla]|uniref:Uncharacterized protein n=1 Tax=Flemingia macrophylla TaxID=520843 RepID=A0ABD1MBI5_9FABA